MTNEFLFFATIIINLSLICIFYRFFGKIGLFCWVAFASIVANIEVCKCVDIFGFSVTLGNVLYGSTFLCTDILSEKYGGKKSRESVWIGFASLIVFVAVMKISIGFIPNEHDFASPLMQELFSLTPRICVVSLISYFISNTIDTYLYEWMRSLTKKKWVCNNVATMTSQLLDSFLFTFGAFLSVFSIEELLELSVTTYAIKVIIAVMDTPFLYIACRLKPREI